MNTDRNITNSIVFANGNWVNFSILWNECWIRIQITKKRKGEENIYLTSTICMYPISKLHRPEHLHCYVESWIVLYHAVLCFGHNDRNCHLKWFARIIIRVRIERDNMHPKKATCLIQCIQTRNIVSKQIWISLFYLRADIW